MDHPSLKPLPSPQTGLVRQVAWASGSAAHALAGSSSEEAWLAAGREGRVVSVYQDSRMLWGVENNDGSSPPRIDLHEGLRSFWRET